MRFNRRKFSEYIDSWYNNLTDEVKHQRIIQNDISEEEYTLSLMRDGDEVEIYDVEIGREVFETIIEIIPKLEIRNKKITELLK